MRLPLRVRERNPEQTVKITIFGMGYHGSNSLAVAAAGRP